jgi:acyl phosphate:glycerol-3-phosphate acyltransferase
MIYLWTAIAGYLIGSIPTGVVLSKAKYGLDVREMGSGNIGATNVTRVFGWYAGVLTFTIDFLKGFFPLYLLDHFLPGRPWLMVTAGAAIVLGHCYSAYLKFKGGKGVATSLGALFSVAPWAAAIATAFYAILVFTTRISAVGSLGGVAAALLYLVIAKPRPPEPQIVLIFLVATIIVVRHHTNIRRLIQTVAERRKKK